MDTSRRKSRQMFSKLLTIIHSSKSVAEKTKRKENEKQKKECTLRGQVNNVDKKCDLKHHKLFTNPSGRIQLTRSTSLPRLPFIQLNRSSRSSDHTCDYSQFICFDTTFTRNSNSSCLRKSFTDERRLFTQLQTDKLTCHLNGKKFSHEKSATLHQTSGANCNDFCVHKRVTKLESPVNRLHQQCITKDTCKVSGDEEARKIQTDTESAATGVKKVTCNQKKCSLVKSKCTPVAKGAPVKHKLLCQLQPSKLQVTIHQKKVNNSDKSKGNKLKRQKNVPTSSSYDKKCEVDVAPVTSSISYNEDSVTCDDTPSTPVTGKEGEEEESSVNNSDEEGREDKESSLPSSVSLSSLLSIINAIASNSTVTSESIVPHHKNNSSNSSSCHELHQLYPCPFTLLHRSASLPCIDAFTLCDRVNIISESKHQHQDKYSSSESPSSSVVTCNLTFENNKLLCTSTKTSSYAYERITDCLCTCPPIKREQFNHCHRLVRSVSDSAISLEHCTQSRLNVQLEQSRQLPTSLHRVNNCSSAPLKYFTRSNLNRNSLSLSSLIGSLGTFKMDHSAGQRIFKMPSMRPCNCHLTNTCTSVMSPSKSVNNFNQSHSRANLIKSNSTSFVTNSTSFDNSKCPVKSSINGSTHVNSVSNGAAKSNITGRTSINGKSSNNNNNSVSNSTNNVASGTSRRSKCNAVIDRLRKLTRPHSTPRKSNQDVNNIDARSVLASTSSIGLTKCSSSTSATANITTGLNGISMCSSVGNCSNVSCCNHLPVKAFGTPSHVVRSRSSCTIHPSSHDDLLKVTQCYIKNNCPMTGKNNYDCIHTSSVAFKCSSGQMCNEKTSSIINANVTSVNVPMICTNEATEQNDTTCNDTDAPSSAQTLEGSFVTLKRRSVDHMSSLAVSGTNNVSASSHVATSSAAAAASASMSTIVALSSTASHNNYNHHQHQHHHHVNNYALSHSSRSSNGSCNLRRFSSDESITCDSGCGSSMKTASLSSDSNRSSICTVEESTTVTCPSSKEMCTSSGNSTNGSGRATFPFIAKAQAKSDCTPCAYDKDALAFKKGDIVNVIAKADSGKWIGSCNGKIGHFDFANVEEISKTSNLPSSLICNNSTSKCQSSDSGVSGGEDTPSLTSTGSSDSSVSRNNALEVNCPPATDVTSIPPASCCITSPSKVTLSQGTIVSSVNSNGATVIRVNPYVNNTTCLAVTCQSSPIFHSSNINNVTQERSVDDKNTTFEVTSNEATQFSRLKNLLPFLLSQSSESISLENFFQLLPFGTSAVNSYVFKFNSFGIVNLRQLLERVTDEKVDNITGNTNVSLISICISNESHRSLLYNALDFFGGIECENKSSNSNNNNNNNENGKLPPPLPRKSLTMDNLSNELKNCKNIATERSTDRHHIDLPGTINTGSSKFYCDVIDYNSTQCNNEQERRVSVTSQDNENNCSSIESSNHSGEHPQNNNNSKNRFLSIRNRKLNLPLSNQARYSAVKSAPSTPATDVTTDDLTAWFRRFSFFGAGKDNNSSQQSKSCERPHEESVDANDSPASAHASSLSTSTSIDGFMSLGHTCNSRSKNGKNSGNLGKNSGTTNNSTVNGTNNSSVSSLKRPGLRSRSKSFFGHQSQSSKTKDTSSNATAASICGTIDRSRRHLHQRSASVVPPASGRSNSICNEPLYVNFSNTNTTGNIHYYLHSISGNASGNLNCPSNCTSLGPQSLMMHQQQQHQTFNSGEQLMHSLVLNNCMNQQQSDQLLSSSAQLDANFIMAKLAHTYSRKNSPQVNYPRLPLSSTGQITTTNNRLASGQFSKSAVDLRQEVNCCSLNSHSTNTAHTSCGLNGSGSVNNNCPHSGTSVGSNVVRRTAASVKRFLLSQTSLPQSNDCQRHSSENGENIYGNIGSVAGNINFLNDVSTCSLIKPAQIDMAPSTVSSSSLVNSFSRSLSHLSAKQVSTCILEALSKKLITEAIDLTEDPYSDSSGFCGIPPALVQRYKDELDLDLYEIAEALDRLRLEALAVKGRSGIPNDFLGDSCNGPVVETSLYTEGLKPWLISIGLPMYYKHFADTGYDSISKLIELKESDFDALGVKDKRHQLILESSLSGYTAKSSASNT